MSLGITFVPCSDMLHKTKHYWRKYHEEKRVRDKGQDLRFYGNLARILRMLSKAPEHAVNYFDRFVAFLSTPFKRLGVWGWKKTGHVVRLKGLLVRDGAHSTDGFWTLDVRILELFIGGKRFVAPATSPRFIRIEVEPGTRAHAICSRVKPIHGHIVKAEGPLIIDNDGPFLEVHPADEFELKRLELKEELIEW